MPLTPATFSSQASITSWANLPVQVARFHLPAIDGAVTLTNQQEEVTVDGRCLPGHLLVQAADLLPLILQDGS